MSEVNFRYFEFGEFRLDAYRRILHKNGAEVHLTPRALDLLCVMVEHPDRVLGHDELLNRVWEGLFVEQGNLKKTVSALRQALGESAEAGEFITTVPRRGYRFTVPVRQFVDDSVLLRETHAEIVAEEEIEDDPQTVTLTEPAKTLRKSSRIRTAFAVGAVLVLMIGIFAAWRYWQPSSPRLSADSIKTKRLLLGSNMIDGVLSPDGNFFCYVVSDDGLRSLWVKQVSTDGVLQILPPVRGSFWSLAFAPDSSYVYYLLNNEEDRSKTGIYRTTTFGGVPQLVIDKAYTNLSISPDGRRIAVIRTSAVDNIDTQELLTVNTDGSDEMVVVSLPKHSLFRHVAWAPDGATIAFAVKKQDPNEQPEYRISEAPATGGGAEKTILPYRPEPILLDGWTPDKQSLILRMREPNSQFYQLRQYFPASNELLRVTNDDRDYKAFTVTSDGKTIGGVRTQALANVWIRDGDKDPTQTASGSFDRLSYAADGRVVFSTTENGKEVVGIMDEDGRNRRILTDGEDGVPVFPRVSGDGKSIVFISSRSGTRQAWQITLDGRELKQLTNTPGGVGEARLLADGRAVIYDTYVRTATWCLFKQDTTGGIFQVTDTDTLDWDVSPDGKLLAIHTTDEKTKKKILIFRETDGGKEVRRFDANDVSYLRWTRDGKAVAFTRPSEDSEEMVVLSLDGTPERILFRIRGERLGLFDWSFDGSRLAQVRTKMQYEAVLILSRDR